MDKKSYYISKDSDNNGEVYFEYEKVDGYSVKPKVKKDNSIEVSKIVFVNPEFSEKIIRKKIDKKIAQLLNQLKIIEETGDNDEGAIRKSLMTAEKLRLQIINNYVKYLGHTYHGLTLKKLQIIINQLRYKLYIINEMDRDNFYNVEKESRRGR